MSKRRSASGGRQTAAQLCEPTVYRPRRLCALLINARFRGADPGEACAADTGASGGGGGGEMAMERWNTHFSTSVEVELLG